jgi:hypothetical protein
VTPNSLENLWTPDIEADTVIARLGLITLCIVTFYYRSEQKMDFSQAETGA